MAGPGDWPLIPAQQKLRYSKVQIDKIHAEEDHFRETGLKNKVLTKHLSREAIRSASHMGDIEIVVVSDWISAAYHHPAT